MWVKLVERGQPAVFVVRAKARPKPRKLCYRKDDRAMRPIYGCPENFRDFLTTPTTTFLKILWDFVPMVQLFLYLLSFARNFRL